MYNKFCECTANLSGSVPEAQVLKVWMVGDGSAGAQLHPSHQLHAPRHGRTLEGRHYTYTRRSVSTEHACSPSCLHFRRSSLYTRMSVNMHAPRHDRTLEGRHYTQEGV